MKMYIVSYDIVDVKRAYKVRKLVYSYAIDGQKSVLEIPLGKSELKALVQALKILLAPVDSVHIIQVDKVFRVFGKADILSYDEGMIIV